MKYTLKNVYLGLHSSSYLSKFSASPSNKHDINKLLSVYCTTVVSKIFSRIFKMRVTGPLTYRNKKAYLTNMGVNMENWGPKCRIHGVKENPNFMILE